MCRLEEGSREGHVCQRSGKPWYDTFLKIHVRKLKALRSGSVKKKIQLSLTQYFLNVFDLRTFLFND